MDLPEQFRSGVVREEESGLAEMFFQVGAAGMSAQRAPFIAIGRQQENFPVAAIHEAGKNRGHGRAQDGLGKDEISVGQEKLDVAANQLQIPHVIRLLRGRAPRNGRLGTFLRRFPPPVAMELPSE